MIIKVRRGKASLWVEVNPILQEGEMGLETDTRKFKFGTGATPWNDLEYAVPDDRVTSVAGMTGDITAEQLASAAVSDASLASFVEDPASQTRAAIEAIAGGGGGAPLAPDPVNDGFYVIPSGSTLTPDPDHSGFYKIGA